MDRTIKAAAPCPPDRRQTRLSTHVRVGRRCSRCPDAACSTVAAPLSLDGPCCLSLGRPPSWTGSCRDASTLAGPTWLDWLAAPIPCGLVTRTRRGAVGGGRWTHSTDRHNAHAWDNCAGTPPKPQKRRPLTLRPPSSRACHRRIYCAPRSAFGHGIKVNQRPISPGRLGRSWPLAAHPCWSRHGTCLRERAFDRLLQSGRPSLVAI